MGNEIGLGDHIAFRSPDISSFEIVAVITKLLNGGSFLCYSTTPPLSGLGEFALLPSDLGEIEVICQGEDAVRNQSDGELELGQRVEMFGEELTVVEGSIVALIGSKLFIEDDDGLRHIGQVEFCVPAECD